MDGKKRIALVGPMHPYRGGIAHFLETMYWGLEGRGHRMDAITFTRQYPESVFPGKTQLQTEEVESPVPAKRIIDTVNPLSWYRAAAALEELAPDTIIFKYWMPFFAPAFGTISRKLRKRGTRILVVVDNAIPHERRPGDIVLGRYFLRSAHGLLTMSDTVRQDLGRIGVEGEVRSVKHPVYDTFGQPVDRAEARASFGIVGDTPTLLFFGFIRKYKGLQVLLEAMPRILEKIPDARLLVAGEFYDDPAPYEALIEDGGLADSVKLADGYIPDSAVARYFSAADVVVQPYVSATQSGVAQIAFHFDKPAIITDVGSLAETVPHEKAGLVVAPGDPSALAGAVVRFFEEGLGESLSEGVRREKPKYSWDRFYETVEELA